MKIVQIIGGLGNQMFQYACYKALEKDFTEVKADLNGFKTYKVHNGFEIENIFDIKLNKISSFSSELHTSKSWLFRKIRRLLNLKGSYKEETNLFSFDPDMFSNPKNKYYSGYWQNEKYFIAAEKEIRQAFQFKLPADQKNQETLKQIREKNSISIHVRRGDYIKDPLLGGLCDQTYYQKAIQLITSKTTSIQFFIFSDDIDWCKQNLPVEGAEFVSWNKGDSSYIDMQLMSTCKHHIIANSSFSWWGAWLNENPDKIVIGPKKWMNNTSFDTSTLLPATWIKL